MNKQIIMGIVANGLYTAAVFSSRDSRPYVSVLVPVFIASILVSILGAVLMAGGRRKVGAILVCAGCVPFVPVGLIGIRGAQPILKEERAGFWSTPAPWIIEAAIVLPLMILIGVVAGSTLQELVDGKHPLLVRMKLSVSGPASIRDEEMNSALYWASSHNDFAMVKLLIEKGADIRHISFGLLTTEIFKYVLEKGADPKNVRIEEIYNSEIFKYAVVKGANVNARVDEQGNTRLMSAVQQAARHSPEFDAALERAKQREASPGQSHETSWNNDSPFRNLLSHGANVNAKNQDGQTALMTVFIGNENYAGRIERVVFSDRNKEIPLLLLDKGADITARDNDGSTALMYALSNFTLLSENGDLSAEDLDVLSLLIARKADVNAVDKQGDTPLRIAQNINNPKERTRVVALLKKAGAKR